MYSRHQFYLDTKAQYLKANAEAKAAGQKPPGLPILTKSYLRFEQFITATTTQYTFPVIVGNTTATTTTVQPNEIRLQQNDNFHIYRLGMYLAVTAASTDTGFRLMTNPNEIFLVTAAAQLSYLNLWNGNLNLNINQTDVVTNWHLQQHFYVPQTQRLVGTVNNNFDQIMLKDDGMIDMEPNIMLSGAHTITLTINLNAAIGSALASNNSRIVLLMDGLRAQNAAIRK